MRYRLITKSPVTIEIDGQIRRFSANQSVLVRQNDRNRIIRGMHRNKFVDTQEAISEEQDQPTAAEQSEVISLQSQPAESEEPAEDASHTKAEDTNAEPEGRTIDEKLEALGLPNPNISQSEHWATVRKEVQKLEEQSPVPYDLVEAYKVKFSNYTKVVEECDRILAQKDNPHVE